MDLNEVLQVMKTKRPTPDWLFELPVRTIKRANMYPVTPAVNASFRSTGASINLVEENVLIEPDKDIAVIYRGPLNSVTWVAGRRGRVVDGMQDVKEPYDITIFTDDFPGSNTIGRAIIHFWATFDP